MTQIRSTISDMTNAKDDDIRIRNIIIIVDDETTADIINDHSQRCITSHWHVKVKGVSKHWTLSQEKFLCFPSVLSVMHALKTFLFPTDSYSLM